MTTLTITPHTIQLSPGSDVVLQSQTWADYEALLATRDERTNIKIYFNAQTRTVRLMAPSPRHGNRSDALSDLVKCLLRSQGEDWQSFDPITLKRFEEKGVESDTCFYIQSRNSILGKEKIDLAVDPPPDLALEVALTSLTHPQDYEDIAVPELWIYRGERLSIYVFEDGCYTEQAASPTFGNVPVRELMPKYVEKAWREGVSVAVREFEAWLQSSL
ncbi:MAG: Uma2 family endonuclease [Cyanobacteria bacterium J06649_4]